MGRKLKYCQCCGIFENLLKIKSYSYINTKDNVANLLTKYTPETKDFKDIFINGTYTKGRTFLKLS